MEIKRTPFDPLTVNQLTLRNRIIKSATFEGKCPNGRVSDDLIEFHRAVGAGGAAMTTVAYGAVSAQARTFDNQIVLESNVTADLNRLTQAVHETGVAASIQLAHGGAFSKHRAHGRRQTKGPSFGINTYGLLSGIPFARSMRESDLAETLADYERAAVVAVEAGFDAIEIHMGHGYLLSQFLSPLTNKRRDAYGGSLENRLRFPLEVLESVRRAVGPSFPLLAKINLDDGVRGGLQVADAVQVARALEAAGLDGLVMSGGNVARSPMYLFRGPAPRKEMIAAQNRLLDKVTFALAGPFVIRSSPYEEMFFLEMAKQVRAATSLPLFLLGGVKDLASLVKAVEEGFDGVAMARALLHDPNLINQYQAGSATTSGCTTCNKCVAEMDRPGGIRCVLSDREADASPQVS